MVSASLRSPILQGGMATHDSHLKGRETPQGATKPPALMSETDCELADPCPEETKAVEQAFDAGSHTGIADADPTAADEEDALVVTPSQSVTAKADELDRRIKEQNHLFWESCRRKDDTLQVLQEECRVVATQLAHTEAAAQQSVAMLACAAHEAERDATREALQAARTRSCMQVAKHSAEVEGISGDICAARSKCSSSEAAAAEASKRMGELEADMRRWKEELAASSEGIEMDEDFTHSVILHSSSKLGKDEALTKLQVLNSELVEVQRNTHDSEIVSSRQAGAWRQRLLAMRRTGQEEFAAASAALQHSSSELAGVQRQAKLLQQSLEGSEARLDQEVLKLQQALQRAAAESSGAVSLKEASCSKTSAASAELDGLMQEEARLKELVRRARADYQAGLKALTTETALAAEAARAADLARKQVQDAQEKREAAEDKASLMTKEMEVCRRREAEEALLRDEEKAVALQTAQLKISEAMEATRLHTTREEQKLKEAMAAAEAAATAAEAQALEEKAKEAALRQEESVLEKKVAAAHREQQMAEEAMQLQHAAHASEHKAMLHSISALTRSLSDAHAEYEKEEGVAQESQQEAKLAKKQMAIELRTESSSCASWREKAARAQVELQQLKEAEASKFERHQQHLKELATAKEEAGRHGRAATDMRAELVLKSQEATGSRAPPRGFDHVQQELWVSRNRLSQMQQGCSSLEAQLAASRSAEARLASELHDAVEQLSELKREDVLWVRTRSPAQSPVNFPPTPEGFPSSMAKPPSAPQPFRSGSASFECAPPWRSRSYGAIGAVGPLSHSQDVFTVGRTPPQGSSVVKAALPENLGVARAHSLDGGRVGSAVAMSASRSDGSKFIPAVLAPLPVRRSPPPLPPLPAGSLPCSPSAAVVSAGAKGGEATSRKPSPRHSTVNGN
mmetsp:Transcript_32192/g.75588  ORF Transcript_32192/g.75588 Transcript_32192/m.75588 type:complete len:917 (-) Transcript_32192:38-2788(-)